MGKKGTKFLPAPFRLIMQHWCGIL